MCHSTVSFHSNGVGPPGPPGLSRKDVVRWTVVASTCRMERIGSCAIVAEIRDTARHTALMPRTEDSPTSTPERFGFGYPKYSKRRGSLTEIRDARNVRRVRRAHDPILCH